MVLFTLNGTDYLWAGDVTDYVAVALTIVFTSIVLLVLMRGSK